ncbi:helix-turn-helix transcriptional regulator [Streptomyces bottropensis]|uniref:helix-turn-helix transcriptional regulator n=1 Tax=Streptomyces bottropensis TaxID=42235 RepID=UPI0036A34AB2
MTASTRRRRAAADPWVPLTDALDEIGISRATYYRWRNRGYAPEVRRLPNGHLRVRRSVLDAFLNDLEVA